MHSMVLMVTTTASEPSLVQGTWILNSWMCPLRKVKGSFNSYGNNTRHVSVTEGDRQETVEKTAGFVGGPSSLCSV